MNKASIGTVSHGTLRNEDLLSSFAQELQWLTVDNRTDKETALIAEADGVTDFETVEATELVGELIDALDRHAPQGCAFGAHEGDGSDFGFWPIDDE